MDWPLLAASVALVAVTGGLVYFTWGLVKEAQLTRVEMRATRGEMEETRLLGVRPHLTLEPVMLATTYGVLGLRNLGPGTARNVSVTIAFDPLGDVRDFDTPVILPGEVEPFDLPRDIKNLDGARDANLVSTVRGTYEDIYGKQFTIDLSFDWRPWVEKLTTAVRIADVDHLKKTAKALEAISEDISAIRESLQRR